MAGASAKERRLDPRFCGNDNVAPSAALRAGLAATAKQKTLGVPGFVF